MHMLSTCDWLDDWLSIIILTYAECLMKTKLSNTIIAIKICQRM